jgi:hypothetical protein
VSLCGGGCSGAKRGDEGTRGAVGADWDGGESRTEVYWIEDGRFDNSASGEGASGYAIGVGFLLPRVFVGLGSNGGSNCFGAMGRASMNFLGVCWGGCLVDGDVRAGGGGRGRSMIVGSSSDPPTLSNSSSNSSTTTVTSGLTGRFRPRGIVKYPGDAGPCEGPLGVKKSAFG